MLLKMPEEASFAWEAMHGVTEAMLMSSGTVPSELQQAAMDPFKNSMGSRLPQNNQHPKDL